MNIDTTSPNSVLSTATSVAVASAAGSLTAMLVGGASGCKLSA
jgi:hypothetical protein